MVCKPVLTTPEEIGAVLLDADVASDCIGIVAWMHTFSPAKIWTSWTSTSPPMEGGSSSTSAPHAAPTEGGSGVLAGAARGGAGCRVDACRRGLARQSPHEGGPSHSSLREAARIELGLRSFLGNGGFHAFPDAFENLHGLNQLPGIASQRLMAEGYGFGAEGD